MDPGAETPDADPPRNPAPRVQMKTLLQPLVAAIAACLLASCIFEQPFDATARIPVDRDLLGRWEEQHGKPTDDSQRMLVLQHSANEYLVHYPSGDKGMYFRAFAVELEGQRFLQTQLLGSHEGPAPEGERKYHLFQVKRDGDTLTLRAIDADTLGRDATTTAELRKAFAAHHNDPELFGEATSFQRVPAEP